VIPFLLEQYGSEEVGFVPFAGSDKAQILALQAANYGQEQADPLGIAHSFRQAVEAGATAAEIARNVGQPVAYVTNHLALTEIPPELAQRIAAGQLPLSVATTVADLPEPKRSGLAIFILAAEPGQLTAKAIKECGATLKKWPGLQLPLVVKHQTQRNMARALVNLWQQAVAAYPEDTYAAAAMLIYRDLHDAPWASQEKLSRWFQVLGGDTYWANGKIHWSNVIAYLLPEVGCQSCPVAQLPQQPLQNDLAQGQGDRLVCPAAPAAIPLRPRAAVFTAWLRMTPSMCVSPGPGVTMRVWSMRGVSTGSKAMRICWRPGKRRRRKKVEGRRKRKEGRRKEAEGRRRSRNGRSCEWCCWS
jgi:hypothetical protein